MLRLSLVAAGVGGYSLVTVCGFLLAATLFFLWSTGSRAWASVVSHAARGIFPDQGLHPSPPHCHADSQPLASTMNADTTAFMLVSLVIATQSEQCFIPLSLTSSKCMTLFSPRYRQKKKKRIAIILCKKNSSFLIWLLHFIFWTRLRSSAGQLLGNKKVLEEINKWEAFIYVLRVLEVLWTLVDRQSYSNCKDAFFSPVSALPFIQET